MSCVIKMLQGEGHQKTQQHFSGFFLAFIIFPLKKRERRLKKDIIRYL